MTTLLWIIFYSTIAIIIFIVIPSIIKILLRKRFLAKIKKDNCIYLTFDDGPNPDSTPQILEILKKHNVKATFFVTGKNVTKYPGLVHNILQMGHDLGDHSYNHHHAWKTDPITSILDFMKFNKILSKIKPSEKNLKLYRPPYGKFNIVTLLCSLILLKKLIFWDIDPKDYQMNSSNLVFRYVLNGIKSGGIVILLHDGRNHKGTTVDITIKAVDKIIIASRNKGFQFCLFNSNRMCQ